MPSDPATPVPSLTREEVRGWGFRGQRQVASGAVSCALDSGVLPVYGELAAQG